MTQPMDGNNLKCTGETNFKILTMLMGFFEKQTNQNENPAVPRLIMTYYCYHRKIDKIKISCLVKVLFCVFYTSKIKDS